MIIAVRGIDGSGKSTAVGNTVSALLGRDVAARATKVALVANPAFSRYHPLLPDQPIKVQALLRRALAVAETLRTVQEDVIPAHLAGEVVVCDRYWADTLTYLRLRGLASEETDQVLTTLRAPDLEVVLDVPLEVAEERCRRLGEVWSDSSRRILRDVRTDLLETAGSRGAVVIDGTRPDTVVSGRIIELIDGTRPDAVVSGRTIELIDVQHD